MKHNGVRWELTKLLGEADDAKWWRVVFIHIDYIVSHLHRCTADVVWSRKQQTSLSTAYTPNPTCMTASFFSLSKGGTILIIIVILIVTLSSDYKCSYMNNRRISIYTMFRRDVTDDYGLVLTKWLYLSLHCIYLDYLDLNLNNISKWIQPWETEKYGEVSVLVIPKLFYVSNMLLYDLIWYKLATLQRLNAVTRGSSY